MQIASTGESVLRGTSVQSMLAWKRRAVKKALKDKRRREEIKAFIRAGNLAIAWIDYDQYKYTVTLKQLTLECSRVFKGINEDD